MSTAAYVNGYRPYQFTDLSGGLNLRDKADAVGDREAIDLLNVDFAERGSVRQRDGFADFTPADLTNRVDSLAPFYNAAGLQQLIAGCGTRLEAIDGASGAVVASATGLARGPWTFARFGDPTHEYLYAANGADTVRRWDGAAWAVPAATVNGAAGAMPKAGAITVTAAHPGSASGTNASNRLVATAFGTLTTGGPGGAASTPSRVFFSNAGQPEVWETDGFLGSAGANPPYSDARGRNYIDLTPGDGERIQAAVTWRELVFIFKETKFFVLWGEGVGSDRAPTFQVREVVNAIGLAAPQAVAIGRDGVYFTNRRGVYRTSGQDPVLLSDIVAPMWNQHPEVYFRSKPINLAQLDKMRMLWHMERLYLAIATGASLVNDRVLVYDTQQGWWSLYDAPASALASFRAGVTPSVHLGYASGPQRIGRSIVGRTTDRDPAVPMVSRWRSGWSDYDSSQVKTLRETKAWGEGVVMVTFSTDFNLEGHASLPARFTAIPGRGDWIYALLTAQGGTYDTLDDAYGSYSALTANTSLTTVIASVLLRYAIRGTVFSTEFANHPDASSWSVHRVARHMREIREPSVVH